MHAVYRAQEGGLAATARSDNGSHGTSRNVERYSFQDPALTERDRKIADSDSRRFRYCRGLRFFEERRRTRQGLKLCLAFSVVHYRMRRKIVS